MGFKSSPFSIFWKLSGAASFDGRSGKASHFEIIVENIGLVLWNFEVMAPVPETSICASDEVIQDKHVQILQTPEGRIV